MNEQISQQLSASIERHLRDYFNTQSTITANDNLYDQVLQEIERPLLMLTLAQCRGNQIKAAAMLGLNRNTLRKKLRALGITPVRKGKD